MLIPRLKTYYKDIIYKDIKKHFRLLNDLSIPKINTVTLSSTTQDAISSSKVIPVIYDELYRISGQKPVVIKARKSVAAFKLRKGMSIGAKVTLRRNHMYEFIDRLVNIALPRIRDFKGLNKQNFDGNGNYAFGIKEQIIFPEIEFSQVDKIRGLGIVIQTTTSSDDQARYLLERFNFPFI